MKIKTTDIIGLPADIPALAGNDGKALFVNAAGDALEWDTVSAGSGSSGAAVLLATVTIPDNATSSATLMANIPQTYREIFVEALAGSTSADGNSSDTCHIEINGDTGANYNWTLFGAYTGSGSPPSPAAYQTGANGDTSMGFGALASTGIAGQNPAYIKAVFPRYADNLASHTMLAQGVVKQQNVANFAVNIDGIYTPSASGPITQIDVISPNHPFSQGSVFRLYGIPDGTAATSAGSKQWDFSPPKAADFTTKQGAGTLTLTDDADVGLIFSSPRDGTRGASDAMVLQSQPIPNKAADWTVTAKIKVTQPYTTNQPTFIGLMLTDASGAHCMNWGLDFRNMQADVYKGFFTLPYGFVGDETQTGWTGTHPEWFRIVHTAATATLSYQVSADGKVWGEVVSGSDTEGFGAIPDNVGIGNRCNTSPVSNYPIAASVPYFAIT